MDIFDNAMYLLAGEEIRGLKLNLRYANLSGADLSGATLCDANMNGALVTYLGNVVRVRFEAVE